MDIIIKDCIYFWYDLEDRGHVCWLKNYTLVEKLIIDKQVDELEKILKQNPKEDLTENPYSWLELAIMTDQSNIIKMLVKYGATIGVFRTSKTKFFNDPMEWACVKNQFDTIEILLEHGAKWPTPFLVFSGFNLCIIEKYINTVKSSEKSASFQNDLQKILDYMIVNNKHECFYHLYILGVDVNYTYEKTVYNKIGDCQPTKIWVDPLTMAYIYDNYEIFVKLFQVGAQLTNLIDMVKTDPKIKFIDYLSNTGLVI